ncbi:MAG: type II secretion system protein GspD [Planctomycetota bacterium]
MGSPQQKTSSIVPSGIAAFIAAAGLLMSGGMTASVHAQDYFEDGYFNPDGLELDEDTFGDDAFGEDAFAEEEKGIDGSVEVSEFLTVDIHVNDTDLAQVLQMLSMQSQKNIVMSSSVAASISADLYDVTLYEALDAILNVNGFGYIEDNGFIYVYTSEEIADIERAQRVMVTEVFRLNYINASDASIFLTPLLSDEGVIALNGPVGPGFEADVSDGGEDSWAFGSVLVVTDYPENLAEMSRVLRLLDTRPKQVLVEATVLQTTLNEDNAWGIDWNIVFDANFGDVTNPLSPVDDLVKGSFQPDDNKAGSVGTNLTSFANSSTLKIGVVSEDISVFLRVLDAISDSNVISRPKALALNRQRGEILIGRKIGYLSSTSTETSTTQTVQFLETGTHLKFRPFVSDDNFIRMELEPSVSEGIIREVTGQDNAVFTIPDEITQELQTNVNVPDGHTIVLGGLFKEETIVTRRQVPLLGDIPLLGSAFRGHEDKTRRSEITFLITPSIMQDEVLIAEGEAALDHITRTRIGIRRETLPWSRDRMTAQHAMKAEEYLREGDSEMALWEIDRSLSLNPNQPMVIKMREEITGQRERIFIRSFIKETIQERIEAERSGSVTVPTSTVPKQPQESASAGTGMQFATPTARPKSVEAAGATPQPELNPNASFFQSESSASSPVQNFETRPTSERTTAAVTPEQAQPTLEEFFPAISFGFAFDPFCPTAQPALGENFRTAWTPFEEAAPATFESNSQFAEVDSSVDQVNDASTDGEDPFDYWRNSLTEVPPLLSPSSER